MKKTILSVLILVSIVFSHALQLVACEQITLGPSGVVQYMKTNMKFTLTYNYFDYSSSYESGTWKLIGFEIKKPVIKELMLPNEVDRKIWTACHEPSGACFLITLQGMTLFVQPLPVTQPYLYNKYTLVESNNNTDSTADYEGINPFPYKNELRKKSKFSKRK